MSVSDTGEGIPKSGLREIFQPFTQVDEVSTRKYGGTGLGLSIVRKLVTAHGGKIGVASELGAGSTFTFTLEVRGVECYVGYEFLPAAYEGAGYSSCATALHTCVRALSHATQADRVQRRSSVHARDGFASSGLARSHSPQ